VAGLRDASERRDVELAIFGHAGDGHVHVNALPDVTRRGWREALQGLLDDATALLAGLGGTASGEHGDGRLRAGFAERLLGPPSAALCRAVKRAYDPEATLNPGVIIPAADWAPLTDLKVGEDAASIPEDIAARLRAVERSAGWAVLKTGLAD
jgi:glycolate oxidase